MIYTPRRSECVKAGLLEISKTNPHVLRSSDKEYFPDDDVNLVSKERYLRDLGIGKQECRKRRNSGDKSPMTLRKD